MVKYVSLDPSSNLLNYEIQFQNEKILSTTREVLCPNVKPYNITLLTTFQDYTNLDQKLPEEDFEHIIHPQALTLLEEEYLKYHERLNHKLTAVIIALCRHDNLL